MNIQDYVNTFLTSTFIVSIATYLIQKNIDKRFNRIEDFQKTLNSIKKERYDTVLKTLQEVWEKIIDVEYYIRQDLVEVIKEAQKNKQEKVDFDFSPLKNSFIFIEKRSILLNDKISTLTRDLFIKHFQQTYNGYINILNELKANKLTLEEVNMFIPNSLGEKYKSDLQELRKEFEKQTRDILYDSK